MESQQPEIIKRRSPPSSEGGVSLEETTARFRFKNLAWSSKAGFNGGRSRRSGYQLTLWSWMASFIDALILLGISCLFLVVFAKIVQMPTVAFIQEVKTKYYVAAVLLQTYIVISWFYMVLLRSFFGSSIGEWACDLRLGHPDEAKRSNYILRVLLRATLILMTGVVTLPLISFFLGRDIAGIISGLTLFSLR